MRLLVLITLVVFIAAGVAVGALNADMVGYDLGFAHVRLPKGAALLVILIIGWLLGGLTAWLGVISRHRRDNRRLANNQKKSPATP
jgi:putative membrane protein